jgi:hypothetical protein
VNAIGGDDEYKSSSSLSTLGVGAPTEGAPLVGTVYLYGSYSSSSCSQGAVIFDGCGGGGAALDISSDFRALGGGCDGKGGGPARGADPGGSGGGADEGDVTGDRTETSSKLESLPWDFSASLCATPEAMSVS